MPAEFSSEEDEAEALRRGVFFIGLIVACAALCCYRCCKKKNVEVAQDHVDPVVTIEGVEVPTKHLRHPKDVKTVYVVFFVAGLFGAHHFYLDRLVHGLVAAMTLNFLCFGLCFDLLLIPLYTHAFNAGTGFIAPKERSCLRCFCCIPVLLVAVLACWWCAWAKVPGTLDRFGFIDFDTKLAGTSSNPYVLLGIPKGSSASRVQKAFERKAKDLKTKASCQRTGCVKEYQELQKALDFINSGNVTRKSKARSKKRKEALDEDTAWKDWSDHIHWQWSTVTDVACDEFWKLTATWKSNSSTASSHDSEL